MNNLRKFNWITQYNSAKEGEELVKPSVSLVIDKAVVIYDDDISPIYRWINLDPSEDYECDMEEHIKYYKQKKQVSLDNGATWNDVVPAEYRRGDIYEEKSTDCGYIPKKLTITYEDGSTYEADCDGNTIITSADTHPSGYQTSAMTEAIIGECITSIGERAFNACSGLTSVTIGSGVESIGNQAFYSCRSLTSITIPDSVTSIEDWAFMDCESLTSIAIPNSVISIGSQGFQFCTSLTSVTIGSGITSIGQNGFNRCSGLTSVTIEAILPPSLGNNAFNDTNSCPIYVPDESLNAFKNADKWKLIASRIKPMSEKPL